MNLICLKNQTVAKDNKYKNSAIHAALVNIVTRLQLYCLYS